jgi:menaquinone-dependent protoporphyrinogen IX oxidase
MWQNDYKLVVVGAEVDTEHLKASINDFSARQEENRLQEILMH